MSTSSRDMWIGLMPLQADGLACVICRVRYLRNRNPHRPVGRSATGSQVFACTGRCEQIATEPEGRETA